MASRLQRAAWLLSWRSPTLGSCAPRAHTTTVASATRGLASALRPLPRSGRLVAALAASGALVAGSMLALEPAMVQAEPTAVPAATATTNSLLRPGAELAPVASVHELDVTLYQYQPCPFCNKVRAFLDYNGVPYRIVEVNPLLKTELKSWTSYGKVPVVVVNGVQLNDSDHIITTMRGILPGECPSATESKLTGANAERQERYRAWVNGSLVHLLTANIYRSPGEAMTSFDYLLTSGNFSWSQRVLARYSGAIIMYALSKLKLNKKYGIVHPREELYAAVDEFVDNLQETGYISGTAAPSLADVCIFGAIRSIEGLPTHTDLLRHSKLGPWYTRMQLAVGAPSSLPPEPTDQ